ncbi:hypothetical protein ACHQM5_010807 [Ranunculus cassubicifolius]
MVTTSQSLDSLDRGSITKDEKTLLFSEKSVIHFGRRLRRVRMQETSEEIPTYSLTDHWISSPRRDS